MRFTTKNICPTAFILASAIAFSSCEDWTEPESIDLIYSPSIEEQNPQLYADYLKDLNAYKKAEHNFTFVSFDNKTEAPSKQAERISSLPDSIDVISLNNPDNLNDVLVSEMEKVRKKGTKVIYKVDYAIAEVEWEKRIEEEGEDADRLTENDFLNLLKESTSKQLALCDKYGYDGLTIAYKGQSDMGLNEKDKAIYKQRQSTYFDLINEWREGHAEKMIAFEGNLPYVYAENNGFLTTCEFLILQSGACTNIGAIEIMGMTAYDAIPTEIANKDNIRFIATAEGIAPDDDKQKEGYFDTVDANGKKIRSSKGIAEWMRKGGTSFNKGGMFITHAQYDYYNANHIYQNIREAIAIMNPLH